MRPLRAGAAFLAWAAGAGTALGAEPAPGKVVEVTCRADTAQKYSCYLPAGYDSQKTWPILYCFSPNARGDLFVQRYRDVCEKRGWIVVGSMNSKNGPWAPIKAAIDAMWADTEARFRLSRTMRYASGFSGGARVSFSVAELHSESVSGVIAIGAGLSSQRMPKNTLAVYLTCGEEDFDKRELDPLFEKLKQAGNPVVYRNFPGGHTVPGTELLAEAVEWLDDQAGERKAERFRKGLERVRALAGAGEPAAAYLGLIDLLERNPGRYEFRTEVAKLRKQLERLPAVKNEVRARKAYDAAVAWLDKNRDRIGKYTHVKSEAVRKLQRVADRHAGTRAAALAQARLEQLGAD
ncbi:MAG: hypothetical protein ACE5JG_01580 [Planctomycetota bacterium]